MHFTMNKYIKRSVMQFTSVYLQSLLSYLLYSQAVFIIPLDILRLHAVQLFCHTSQSFSGTRYAILWRDSGNVGNGLSRLPEFFEESFVSVSIVLAFVSSWAASLRTVRSIALCFVGHDY